VPWNEPRHTRNAVRRSTGGVRTVRTVPRLNANAMRVRRRFAFAAVSRSPQYDAGLATNRPRGVSARRALEKSRPRTDAGYRASSARVAAATAPLLRRRRCARFPVHSTRRYQTVAVETVFFGS